MTKCKPERAALRTKALHSVHQGILADEHIAMRVDHGCSGQTELTRVGPGMAPLREQFSIRREMINAGIVGFDDDDMTLGVSAHPFWLTLFSLGHLPKAQVNAIRREFLHPAGHVHDVEIVFAIDGHGSWLVKLTQGRAAGANHLNFAEDAALNGRAQ